MMKTADRVMSKIAIPVIAAAAVLLVIALALDTRGTSNQNNAYIRVINCIVSYNASTRTQEQIEQCYTTVERDLNIRLQRYDSSNK